MGNSPERRGRPNSEVGASHRDGLGTRACARRRERRGPTADGVGRQTTDFRAGDS